MFRTRMIPAGIVSCLLVATATVLFFSQSKDGGGHRAPPKGLFCREPVKDFGDLDVEGPLESQHVFAVTNGLYQTVTIKQVRSSCGCTVSDVDRSTLGPGDTARVTVRVRWSQTIGKQSTTLYVESDAPASPILPLFLRGEVVAPLHVTADTVDFGPIAYGQESTRTVSIVPERHGHRFRVLSVSEQSANLQVKDVSYDPLGSAILTLAMTGQASPLDEVVPISITTDLDSYPQVQVAAVARHRGCIDVQPRVLVFPIKAEKTTKPQQITVTTSGLEKQLPIEIYCNPPQGVHYDVHTLGITGDVQTWRAVLAIAAIGEGTPLSSCSGTIRIARGPAAYELPVTVLAR